MNTVESKSLVRISSTLITYNRFPQLVKRRENIFLPPHSLVWPGVEGIDPLDDVLGRPQGDVL